MRFILLPLHVLSLRSKRFHHSAHHRRPPDADLSRCDLSKRPGPCFFLRNHRRRNLQNDARFHPGKQYSRITICSQRIDRKNRCAFYILQQKKTIRQSPIVSNKTLFLPDRNPNLAVVIVIVDAGGIVCGVVVAFNVDAGGDLVGAV